MSHTVDSIDLEKNKNIFYYLLKIIYAETAEPIPFNNMDNKIINISLFTPYELSY